MTGLERRDLLVTMPEDSGYQYLVARIGDDEGMFLIWNGSKGNADFNEADLRRLLPRRLSRPV